MKFINLHLIDQCKICAQNVERITKVVNKKNILYLFLIENETDKKPAKKSK